MVVIPCAEVLPTELSMWASTLERERQMRAMINTTLPVREMKHLAFSSFLKESFTWDVLFVAKSITVAMKICKSKKML